MLASQPNLLQAILAVVLLLVLGYVLWLRNLIRRISRRIQSALPESERDSRATLSQSVERVLLRCASHCSNEEDKRISQQLADISHDLRTPITAVQGYLETLISLGDSISPAERKEYAEIALRNTQSVIRHVRDLLDVFKNPEQEQVLSRDMFAMNALFEELRQRFEPSASQKSIQFEVVSVAGDANVLADRKLIERALSNLLANAFRYTPDGGRIRISSMHEGKRLRITVEDTGIGIPEADLPNICNRFYRVDKDRSRSTGGAGLGLAITSEILQKHNAGLEVQSKPGKGTRFSFCLDKV